VQSHICTASAVCHAWHPGIAAFCGCNRVGFNQIKSNQIKPPD
jgi:hypothetical protein